MTSRTRALILAGFADLDAADRFLAAPELELIDQQTLLSDLALCASPDDALRSLVWILSAGARAQAGVQAIFDAGEQPRESFFRLLGASVALAEFLARHPEHLALFLEPVSAEPLPRDAAGFRAALLTAVGADPDAAANATADVESPAAGAVALRTAYRAQLARIAVMDLCAAAPGDAIPAVAAALADLAAAALDAALALARAEAQLHFSAWEVADVALAVIGMGKSGARELNYVSDVDVIYVIDHRDVDDVRATEIGTFLATAASRAINGPGTEPALWEVDANLRPEGKDGPLVRTLDSHLQYYQRWAHNWEFQALLKARSMAGDVALGERYIDALAPLVWASSERDGFVSSVQRMRQRVGELIPSGESDREIKLGAGGLRDVEFTVQLLQLVHGKSDASLRVRDTVGAIAALAAGGYIGRSDAAELDQAYKYLRVLEHRVQLHHLRRTHLMPHKEPALRALAKAAEGALSSARPSADSLLKTWRSVKRGVRTLHESIFYRPLLDSVARLSAEEARLSPEAAGERLVALGYLDPRAAMRHIEALTAGISRRAALQRQLLPALLDWLADGVDPDAGLLAFRRLSETLGGTHWYLGMLRDSPVAAERLCRFLSSTRLVADLLEVSSEQTAWLAEDSQLAPRSFEALWHEIKAVADRDAETGIRPVRLIRRREVLRIALADGSALLDQDAVGHSLAQVDQAVVLGALRIAEKTLDEPLCTHLVIMAMGRQGGAEISYRSDADVLYVHQPFPGADANAAQRQAEVLVARVSALLTSNLKPPISAEQVLKIDAELRPEGKKGPLVRSLDSYAEYYQRWGEIWEFQALLRARQWAGQDEVAEDFLAMIAPYRYPEGGISQDAVQQIRRIKARVEAERLPRGADPARHVKLGRGGLSDVEWLVQLKQLQHAHAHPELQVTSTLPALAALGELGLLDAHDAQVLAQAWRLGTQVRSAVVICTGKNADVLPSSRMELEAVARWCGYQPGSAAVLEEDYLRLTRQARGLFERHFYGY